MCLLVEKVEIPRPLFFNPECLKEQFARCCKISSWHSLNLTSSNIHLELPQMIFLFSLILQFAASSEAAKAYNHSPFSWFFLLIKAVFSGLS